jgi:uncharacterized ferritin-like protein (DUF455 family)
MTDSLRRQALAVLLEADADRKAAAAQALDLDITLDECEVLVEPAGIPGRPARPALVAHTQLKARSAQTLEGRAALIHSIVHIELNAIDLALDAVWRFDGLPRAYYLDWLRVAREEALHFSLLRDHLRTLGRRYGDFPAHNALWHMAERTRDDLLARMALVPRTLEARGLDASPAVKAKLLAAGDAAGAAIIDILLRDEIGHVAVGNRWFGWLCAERAAPDLRGARRAARRAATARPVQPRGAARRRVLGRRAGRPRLNLASAASPRGSR